MLPPLRGLRSRRVPRWGRRLLWASLALVGILSAAYSLLGAAVVLSCGGASWTAADTTRAPGLGPPPAAPLVIGHSGSTYWCTRNTLACLAQSLALGATMLEVDIRLSADGYLLAFHDAAVDHQTDGHGAVRTLTWEQLQALHLPHAFTPPAAEADTPPRQRIALLEEVRQAFPATPLLLDVKEHTPPMAAALVAFVQRLEAPDLARIYIKTRHQQVAQRLRQLARPPNIGLTLCERIAFVAYPGVVTVPPGLLDLPLWLVSPARLQRATAAGHLVVVSLVNEAPEMRRALALPGLFGVVTDRPEVAVQLQHR